MAIPLASLAVGTGVGVTSAAFSGQTSSAGNVFQAAASFGCTGGSSPIFLTGLEHGAVSTAGGGLFDLMATAGGTPSIDSVVKRNGAYSLKIAKSSAGASYVASALSPAAGVVVQRFAIRLATLPTASVVQLFSFSANAGSSLDFGYSAATQKFTVNLTLDGVAATNASSTVVAGTWYVVDLKFDVASNPRTVAWRIDGVAQTGVSQSTAGSTASWVLPGSNTTADVYTANYDDLVVSATAADYPIGDGKVLALRPTGMGTHVNPQNFANNGGSAIDATTYTRLDDDPMTSTLSYIYQGVLSATSYIELAMADTSESCFNGVSAVLAYDNFSTSSSTAKTSVFNGAAETAVFSGDMASAALTYKSAVVPSASQWTQSEINGLVTRMGYRSAGPGTPVWHALVLEYDVRLTGPPPAAPSALSATAVSSSQIDLTWTDNATDEDGFKIERSPGGAGTWTQVDTAAANATNYSNTGLSQSTAYDYRVRAYNTGGNSAYSNVASATTTACSGTQTVTANADALPSEAFPTSNFGTLTYLRARSQSGGQNARTLVRFALPAIPSGCAVTAATLRLNATSSAAGRTIQAFRAAAAWTETVVTWNTQPATTGAAATVTSALGWNEWTVTSQVQAMYSGANDGFLLRDSVESSATAMLQEYSSREGANPPQLLVTFG